MKKLYQIIALIILIGCSGSNQENLQSNSTIIKIFNKSEIRDLTRILEFFNKQICTNQQLGKKNFNDCYLSFFERMSEVEKIGSIKIKISFDEQKKMYAQLSDSTFNQIWTFGKVVNRLSNDTLQQIEIKYDCKYVDFLNQLGKDYNVINKYYENFRSIGDIGPSMVADLLINHDSYNFKDIRVKLFVAIHYLTLNDQYERKR
ncbi:MAG: hypothetical protein H8D45_26880 [Bacteroidetes bacterium]|nr:hypothetical protein [Bacteroidota bacterium]MBL7103453.1 hypothetical protein [Bacteroidales bacterium]